MLPGHLTFRERATETQWTEDWMSYRANQEMGRENSTAAGNKIPVVQCITSHFTDSRTEPYVHVHESTPSASQWGFQMLM
jgi:hypothetical protein